MSDFKAETGVYKGYPTISLTKDEKRIYSGGVKKAKIILDILADPSAIEAIKKFVEENTSTDNKDNQ